MTDPAVLWIIGGIISCLVFIRCERQWIRGMELGEAMMLLILCSLFDIMDPISLTIVLIAGLIVFLGNL
jgi:hypothetical protein